MQETQKDGDWGHKTEHTARQLAANFGAPDFVYLPVIIPTGSGNREVSDGLLIAGDNGLILQSKARKPDAVDTADKAARWAEKEINKAAKQVLGTRRTLDRISGIEVTSLRGYQRKLTGGSDWPGVILLDMPTVPPEFLPAPVGDAIVVMTLHDWRQLNRMLLSTSCVIQYIHRIANAATSVFLGMEEDRYFHFAELDEQSPGSSTSLPRLPLDYLSGDDVLYAAMVDERMEDLGCLEVGSGNITAASQRLGVEILDALPPLHRAKFGRKWIEIGQKATQTHHRCSSFMRVQPSVGSIIFYADLAQNYANPETEVQVWLSALALVRHEQLSANITDPGPTLAMAWTGAIDGDPSGLAMHTNVLVDGRSPSTLTFDVRWMIVQEFGILDLDRGSIRSVNTLGRDEQCPCQSGATFGQCHSRS